MNDHAEPFAMSAPRYPCGARVDVTLHMTKREAAALAVLLASLCPANHLAEELFDRLARAIRSYERHEKEQQP